MSRYTNAKCSLSHRHLRKEQASKPKLDAEAPLCRNPQPSVTPLVPFTPHPARARVHVRTRVDVSTVATYPAAAALMPRWRARK
eukprot:50811-Pleurochrysis_carterae.AAC.1